MKKQSAVLVMLLSLIPLSLVVTGIALATDSSSWKPVDATTNKMETQDTIATRLLLPQGFTRTTTNDYGEYIRNLPLLPDNSPVLLHNGQKKANQSIHVAVLDIDVGIKNLQQCADASLRIRTEYLFQAQDFDKINYHLTNGDPFPYTKYRDGYRLFAFGDKAALLKIALYNDSYKTFRNYLDALFSYAGTISVQKESPLIPKEEMQIGDVFVIGGSPGHCIMVVDLCENQDGEKMFLLAQSYMPAQQIHILKNPTSQSPWYSLNALDYPFKTPEWTFNEPCLRRMP